MALKVADRVRENTSTTGTGALDLGGAPAGFRTFSSALSDADTTYYVIEENDQYEIGIGVYSSSALQRSVVLKSSNSDSKIELGGSGAVFISYPADKSVFRDGESQVVVGASGALFSNGTIIKDAKIAELTDINAIGTPSSSNIMTFDFGDQNLLIGDSVGNFATRNVMIGDNVGNSTTPTDAVIIGTDAATEGSTINYSVFIGSHTGPTRSDVSNAPYYSVVMGYNAADEARHESSIIGYKAGINSYSIGATALGYFAGSGVGDYATSIGHQAGANNSDDYTINIGYQAGYSAGGDDSIWVGRVAGLNSNAAVKSIGLGYAAGQSSSADNSVYIGVAAGSSNSTDNMLFVGNNTPASNGSLLKGDIANKRLAIGAADVTLADTLYVGINSANDVGFTIKSATSQAADLTQWKDSAGSSVASLTNSGVMTVHGVYASGGGVQLNNITPIVTNNTLYNVGSVLYWDGSQLSGAVDAYTSGNATYASGQAIENEGLVSYASGQAIENETDLLYVSGAAAYSSGVVTGGIPNFNVIGVNTGSPEYGVDVTGGGASGVIQASGVKLGASGIVFSDGSTQTVAGALSTVDLTAGDGLTGGGTLASNRTFTVGAGTLIDVQADQVDVDLSEAAAATIAHGDNLIFLDGGATGAASKGSTDDLANLLAGDGLTKSNSVMAVNVDDSTIETDSDAIRVKDNGITLAKMAGLARGKIIYGDSSGDPAALTAGGANTVLTSDGTDVSWGSVPVNSYVSGIAAYSSGVVTGGIANFTNVGINTGSPAYGLDVTGGGANGLIQATGVLIGASGVGVGTSHPTYPVDVVQHSGVIRASGVHSTISMNADAATVTFDLDQATTHGVTLGGTRTLALSNVRIGDKFLIRLQQDGTGSRTVNWFSHIKWPGGSAPTLTTTAHKTDLLGFLTASGTGGAYWFDGLVVGQNI